MKEQNWHELPRFETVRPSSTKKEILALGYESFGDAQGSQALQIHVQQAVVGRMIEEGHLFDLAIIEELEQRMSGRMPPIGHKEIITPGLESIQMRFWWQNLLTVIATRLDQDPSGIPSRSELEERAWALGGTSEMSSFTDEEFGKLTAAFEIYRGGQYMNSCDVMTQLWLPTLIEVEQKWLDEGRPRTDTSDPYESVWLRYSQLAHTKAAQGKTVTAREQLYLDMAVFMQLAEADEPDSELVGSYRNLLATYNAKHESAQVPALYR